MGLLLFRLLSLPQPNVSLTFSNPGFCLWTQDAPYSSLRLFRSFLGASRTAATLSSGQRFESTRNHPASRLE